MYRTLQSRLSLHVIKLLKQLYGIDFTNIAMTAPPSVEYGEYAMTFCFELAKKLRKAPKKIAEEVVAGLGTVEGFSMFEVAGAGYINARVDRSLYATEHMCGRSDVFPKSLHVLVEHTSINPNKAAHIGHLRNAILGDTLVRLLRKAGRHVAVQNYIDNTGVQVADVVAAFMQFEGITDSHAMQEHLLQIKSSKQPHFDYYCWDLYARISQWYEEAPGNKTVRLKTLHDIEAGNTPAARIAEVISTAILHRHLETMERLDIRYDFLPRESEILSLHFWDLAFQLLKAKGVLYLEIEGKNKGCWVMKRAGGKEIAPTKAETPAGPDEDAKVIVRSNGTVTYVGKDIAYHLWKFGLLGKDFGYQRFHTYPDGHQVWISAANSEPGAPHFGGVQEIYNVIDSRQSDPQNNVIAALYALGFTEQAAHYTHFSYEMVALTPRCAMELGYVVAEEDQSRSYIEVSGRKGFGVKADDLMDALIDSALTEVNVRHQELLEPERRAIATQIAFGALRYFMLRYTRNTVIAFDFESALAFEGETGPYCQYAVVRARNIFKKAGVDQFEFLRTLGDISFQEFLTADDIWDLWLLSSKLAHTVEQCIQTAEPAFLAKYAFQMAQLFNNFYHKHHILNEPDAHRKKMLLATVAVACVSMEEALKQLGIDVPPVM